MTMPVAAAHTRARRNPRLALDPWVRRPGWSLPVDRQRVGAR